MVVSIGLGAGGVMMVGAVVETESCVAVMMPVAGTFALVIESDGATASLTVVLPPEVCASVGGVGFGAGADDTAVADDVPLSRNLLCDGAIAGVVVVWDLPDASAWPAVPSVGSWSVLDPVPRVDDWAPPEDDTVTPGATSTVSDEPLSTSVVAGVVGADGEALVPPGCVADLSPVEGDSVVSAPPSAPGLPTDGESVVVSGFAHAIPAGAAMAEPTPSATARAPIRPTKLP
jgi:hypothetical protein